MNSRSVDGTVVEKLMKLHPDPEDVPPHLTQAHPVRSEEDFDPNAYFTVLTHLAMKPGYTLGYVYHYINGFGGNPCLYARSADGKPPHACIERQSVQEEDDLFPFLVADDSPDGFFQLVVFRTLAGQFYLNWHANYNDLRILTTPAEIEALISTVNGEDFGTELTAEQIAGLRAIQPQPYVEIFDERVSVTYCVFTKWGGLTRIKEFFRRTPPHLFEDQELLEEVEYNCNVRY